MPGNEVSNKLGLERPPSDESGDNSIPDTWVGGAGVGGGVFARTKSRDKRTSSEEIPLTFAKRKSSAAVIKQSGKKD